MKLTSILAFFLFLSSHSALAQPDEANDGERTKSGARATEVGAVDIVTVEIKDFDDDLCWVAPEWRE